MGALILGFGMFGLPKSTFIIYQLLLAYLRNWIEPYVTSTGEQAKVLQSGKARLKGAVDLIWIHSGG